MTTTSIQKFPISQRDADVITRVFVDRLSTCINKLNADGTYFKPAVQSSDLLPLFLLITLDHGKLWHVKVGDIYCEDVTQYLSRQLKREVRAVDIKRTWMGIPIQGKAYAIALLPDAIKAEKARPELPRFVALNLQSRPADPLAVPIGRGGDGDLWVSLPELGHTLIVGASGAGKSSFIHAALAALTTSSTPDQAQIVLIDPKGSELVAWSGCAHEFAPRAVKLEDTTALLGRLVVEIDRRGELLAQAGARDLAGYNRRSGDQLPYIVCVIDECLELAQVAGPSSELAGYLKTLAIRGRSAGVFLWAGTQHAAAVAGLPRVVATNLTARVVCRVADHQAAESAGCPGAEKISRDCPGRLIAKINGPARDLQGFYLSDDALLDITKGFARSAKVDGVPAKPKCPLSKEYLEIVRRAIAENDGKIDGAWLGKQGLGPKEIERLFTGKSGWDSKPGWIEKRRHNARFVGPELVAIAEQDW